jgi:hypothetical protein
MLVRGLLNPHVQGVKVRFEPEAICLQRAVGNYLIWNLTHGLEVVQACLIRVLYLDRNVPRSPR